MKKFGLKLIRDNCLGGETLFWFRWFKTKRDRDEAQASYEKKAKVPYPLVHRVKPVDR